jgi:hypothetical protein
MARLKPCPGYKTLQAETHRNLSLKKQSHIFVLSRESQCSPRKLSTARADEAAAKWLTGAEAGGIIALSMIID